MSEQRTADTQVRSHSSDLPQTQQTWNSAIEAAALVVQPVPHVDEERTCGEVAAAIRALKAVVPAIPKGWRLVPEVPPPPAIVERIARASATVLGEDGPDEQFEIVFRRHELLAFARAIAAAMFEQWERSEHNPRAAIAETQRVPPGCQPPLPGCRVGYHLSTCGTVGCGGCEPWQEPRP